MLEFSSVIINRGFKIESLFLPLLIFFKAIVFGGIEELGWRYSFQPSIEKRFHILLQRLLLLCVGVYGISCSFILMEV